MLKTELKEVWYGNKTFQIVKEFCHQGVIFHARSLFTCDRETYKEHKGFLGKEYLGEPKKEVEVKVEVIPMVKKKIQKSKKRRT